MNTRDTVNSRATLYGWRSHGAPTHANYVKADKCVQVDYSTTGHITGAVRYRFFKLDDLRFEEATGTKHKKETVLSWLAQ